MRVISLAGAILLAGQPVSTVARQDSQREALRGLGPLAVVVESPAQDAASDGLTQDRLRTVTELALRSAGIRVEAGPTLAKFQSSNSGFRVAYLYVRVNTVLSNGIYAFSIDVYLKELMSFADGSGSAYAATWEAGSIGTIGATRVRDVADSVRESVEQFANDYLAVNPR